jgi:Rieske Fe-S protein
VDSSCLPRLRTSSHSRYRPGPWRPKLVRCETGLSPKHRWGTPRSAPAGGRHCYCVPVQHDHCVFRFILVWALWAFDALLATQILVISIGVVSRGHVRTLTSERGDLAPEFSASRREFLKAIVLSGVVVVVASVFSVVGQSRPSLPTSPPSGLPPNAVTNINQVSSGNPAYFEFPTGYPNIMLMKNDGTLIALSMLCTHVCCQLTYVTGNQLYCPCHGSLFDSNGNVIQGPAVVPLPTVEYTVDSSGNVFATRVNGSSPCIQG